MLDTAVVELIARAALSSITLAQRANGDRETSADVLPNSPVEACVDREHLETCAASNRTKAAASTLQCIRRAAMGWHRRWKHRRWRRVDWRRWR